MRSSILVVIVAAAALAYYLKINLTSSILIVLMYCLTLVCVLIEKYFLSKNCKQIV